MTDPAGTRTRFDVNFTPPPGTRLSGDPNNLNVGGPGTVSVEPAAGTVTIDDERNRAGARGVFRLDDIANVGYRAADELIVVRTATDDREVQMWMKSHADALALLALLPARVTEEFQRRAAAAAEFRERLLEVTPKAPVTPTLIAVNIAVFGLMLLAGAGLLRANPLVHISFGSDFGPLTWTGDYWRLLTAAFIHFGAIHLAFNMYALYNGGDLTERLFGSGRFLLIYLLSALSGSVVSGWWDPIRNTAGASAAVFGVYGALLVFFVVRRRDVPAHLLKPAVKGAGALLLYSLAFGFAVPFVNNAAHIGGLLGGALSGLVLARPLDPAARTTPRPLRLVAAAAGICALLALLALPLLNGSRAPVLEQGREAYERLTGTNGP